MDGAEVATGITSTSYTKTGLNTGTSYVFSVKARNSFGYSISSSEITILAGEVPDAPTSLVQGFVTKTEASFSWTAPSDDGGDTVIDYTIEMDGTEVATGITITSYTQTGLTTGNTYVFTVEARNRVGLSVSSSIFSIIPATIP